MSEWGDFFVAQAGAAAALTGLVFVGVSINLQRILDYPALPNRALEAILLLLQVLLVASLALVPQDSTVPFGSEMLIIAVIIWLVIVALSVRSYRATPRQYRMGQLIHIAAGEIASLPFIVAGIMLVTGSMNGLFALVLGILCSYVVAIYNAWVLLIEINR